MSEPGGDGPYRAPGDRHLGRVLHRYPVMRRARYLGSARAVARPLGPGRLVPPSTLATSPSESHRRPSGERVEVCERGLRTVLRAGVLELAWDQIVAIERVEDPGGLVAVVVRGVHGEAVRLDRSIHGLTELAAELARRRPVTDTG